MLQTRHASIHAHSLGNEALMNTLRHEAELGYMTNVSTSL